MTRPAPGDSKDDPLVVLTERISTAATRQQPVEINPEAETDEDLSALARDIAVDVLCRTNQ